MTCDTFLDRASEYVDGTLDGRRPRRGGGAPRRVRRVPGPRRGPGPREARGRNASNGCRLPANAWMRIADRLHADPAFSMTSATTAAQPSAPGRWAGYARFAWLALAAALVLAIGSALVYVVRQPAGRSRSRREDGSHVRAQPTRTPRIPSKPSRRNCRWPRRTTRRAITNLEQVAKASDSPLDPEVMATLRKNLQVIDSAIDESRTALRTQPDSQFAQESLFDAFRRKVSSAAGHASR